MLVFLSFFIFSSINKFCGRFSDIIMAEANPRPRQPVQLTNRNLIAVYNEKYSVSIPTTGRNPVEIQNITSVVSRTSVQLNVRHRISYDSSSIKVDFVSVEDRDTFIGSNLIDPTIKAIFRYDNFTSRLGKRFLLVGIPPRFRESIASGYSVLESLQLEIAQLLGVDRIGITAHKIFGNCALIYVYTENIANGLLTTPQYTWCGAQVTFFSYPHVVRCKLCFKPSHIGVHTQCVAHCSNYYSTRHISSACTSRFPRCGLCSKSSSFSQFSSHKTDSPDCRTTVHQLQTNHSLLYDV